MDLPFSLEYILHAIEKENEQYSWDLWKTLYPDMTVGNLKFVSFEEFRNKLTIKKEKYTQKTNEEIVSEMTVIVEAYKGR